ncbi:MAG: alpha/beta fold hydrolase [Pseudomonadota bacterium]
MKLATTIHGTAGTPLLIAHGLFGSGRNWGAIGKRLAASRQVTLADMRNHGDSPWADSHNYRDLASDLAPLAGGDVLGHSMGGKAAMALALTQPDRVNRLIVADIAPVAYTHTQQHYIDAMESLDPAAFKTRSEADQALADLIDNPGIRAFLLQSLNLTEGRWQLNLKTLAAEMDSLVGWDNIEATFDGPALFITGSESDYVSTADRNKILSLFPGAEFVEIVGAGHWLHAEKPAEFIAAVEAFLA